MKHFIGMFLLVLCCALPAKVMAEELPFTVEKEVVLDVSKMEVVSDYAPTSSDNVDISLNPTPTARIRKWIDSHFKVTGNGEESVKFVITNASIVEEYIPAKGFSLTSTYKYNANFTVKVSIIKSDGEPGKNFISKVWGTKTIPDSSTIEERTDALAEMTDMLIASLAEQISGGVQSTFRPYIDKNILN